MHGLSLSRRSFLTWGAAATIGASTTCVGGYAYAHDVEPFWLDVVPVSIVLPRLAPAFHGYCIAHISDIHLDHRMTGKHVAAVVELVNAQHPDLVAITGDFVTADTGVYSGPLTAALSELRPRDATVAVLGNHDHWADAALVRAAIHDAGIVELDNDVLTLRRGGPALHIAGLDDYWERHDRLDLVLRRLPRTGAAVLLIHEPDYADISCRTGAFDLQLSGHSHGGQVRLPLLGPLRLPRFARRYPMGMYRVGRMIVYTNRGLGMLPPHLRFDCRPEITVFTLLSPAVSGVPSLRKGPTLP